MTFSLLPFFDLIGTVAFAISGAFVGVHRKMDVFGVNVLAVATACGGGMIRDIIVGETPPAMFRNPFYFCIAILLANVVFLVLYLHRKMPGKMLVLYNILFFTSDTLGLAAFTADGVAVGAAAGYEDNAFLLVFLGFLTAVGGGALRDVLAGQIPNIFREHIYALAAIAGACFMVGLYRITDSWHLATIAGFLLVVLIRCLAVRFDWNLPKVLAEEED